jgi:SPX domain protein involved in polyphosphate accumulation
MTYSYVSVFKEYVHPVTRAVNHYVTLFEYWLLVLSSDFEQSAEPPSQLSPQTA